MWRNLSFLNCYRKVPNFWVGLWKHFSYCENYLLCSFMLLSDTWIVSLAYWIVPYNWLSSYENILLNNVLYYIICIHHSICFFKACISFSFFYLYNLFFIVIWLCLFIRLSTFSSFSISIFLEFYVHFYQYFSSLSSFHSFGFDFLSFYLINNYKLLFELMEFLLFRIRQMA